MTILNIHFASIYRQYEIADILIRFIFYIRHNLLSKSIFEQFNKEEYTYNRLDFAEELFNKLKKEIVQIIYFLWFASRYGENKD